MAYRLKMKRSGGSGGKPYKRRTHFKPPTLMSLEDYCETTPYAASDRVQYGVITKYQGGAKCDVVCFDGKDTAPIGHVRLKGSLQPGRCKQRLTVGSFVLVDDGNIVLVYPNDTARQYVSASAYKALHRQFSGEASDVFVAFESSEKEQEPLPVQQPQSHQDEKEESGDLDLI